MANSNPEPLLRKRTHSANWFIFFPGENSEAPRWLSTGTQDEAEARQVLRTVVQHGCVEALRIKRRDAIARTFMKRVEGGRNIMVCDMITDYIADMQLLGRAPASIETHLRILDLWAREQSCAKKPISSITISHCAPYVNPSSDITYLSRINRLKVLRAFFSYCLRRECIPMNPCDSVAVRTSGIPQDKLIRPKRPPFTDEEIAKLQAYIKPDSWWYGVVLLGKHFGLRVSAAASIEWASLPELKRIRIFTHKGKVVVDEELPAEVADWFSKWPHQGDSPYCFPEAAARVFDLSSAYITTNFARICHRAGIEGRSFHCFRVRKATNEINAIIDTLGGEEKATMTALLVKHGIDGVQKIIGHVIGSRVTASRYFNPQMPVTGADSVTVP